MKRNECGCSKDIEIKRKQCEQQSLYHTQAHKQQHIKGIRKKEKPLHAQPTHASPRSRLSRSSFVVIIVAVAMFTLVERIDSIQP